MTEIFIGGIVDKSIAESFVEGAIIMLNVLEKPISKICNPKIKDEKITRNTIVCFSAFFIGFQHIYVERYGEHDWERRAGNVFRECIKSLNESIYHASNIEEYNAIASNVYSWLEAIQNSYYEECTTLWSKDANTSFFPRTIFKICDDFELDLDNPDDERVIEQMFINLNEHWSNVCAAFK